MWRSTTTCPKRSRQKERKLKRNQLNRVPVEDVGADVGAGRLGVAARVEVDAEALVVDLKSLRAARNRARNRQRLARAKRELRAGKLRRRRFLPSASAEVGMLLRRSQRWV
jgi:HAMP domain-containing protein